MQGLRLREASGSQPFVGVDAAPHTSSSRAAAAPSPAMQRGATQAARAGQDATESVRPTAYSPLPASTPDCSPVSFDTVWTAEGAGATATALLRKLRWLTVGPRYDWTNRCMACATVLSMDCPCLPARAPARSTLRHPMADREAHMPCTTALQGVRLQGAIPCTAGVRSSAGTRPRCGHATGGAERRFAAAPPDNHKHH